MKVSRIVLEKRLSWEAGYNRDNSEMLVGTVELSGLTGDMKVIITPAVVTQMVKLIEKDVAEQAMLNAKAAACAIQETECESKLLAAPSSEEL